MNEEQQAKLGELIEELSSLPTPELIRESCRLVAFQADEKQFRVRMEAAQAAAISAQQIHAYLPMLRQVEEWRIQIGQKIAQYCAEYNQLYEGKDANASRAMVFATHLAGHQDVIRHYWVIAVGRLHRALEIAARESGFKINPEDRSTLESYRDLRDYYEHMENELPGGKTQKKREQEGVLPNPNNIEFGLEMDSMGRVILGDKRIDVNGRGLQKIEELVQRVYEGCKDTAVEKVRKYYRNRPSDIPSPHEIDSSLVATIDCGNTEKA